jgi:hypothetical protein
MHLTRRGTPWNFTKKCHSAFEILKKAFTTAPIISFWIPKSQLVLDVVNTSIIAGLSILPIQIITNQTKTLLLHICTPPTHHHPMSTLTHDSPILCPDMTANITSNDTCVYPEWYTPKYGLGPDRTASDVTTDHSHHFGRSGSSSDQFYT